MASAGPGHRHDTEIQIRADGTVRVDGAEYANMTAYHQSAAFRESNRRCGSLDNPAQFADVLAFSPNDCTINATSIQPDYNPANGSAMTIQVVYHVIEHTNGSGRVADSLLLSQLDILNEDFQALAGSPGAPGTNGKIQFRLASIDPDGNPTTGINRYVNTAWFNDNRDGTGQTAQEALHWDTRRYLNIYTNSASGFLGYATFPQFSAGDPDDGVVLLSTSVGRNAPQGGVYNQGRTATHEVGHYLGLFHTFEGGCGSMAAPYSTGDTLADTTPEAQPQFDCVVSASQCGGGNNPIDNYMDYTNDTCMDHFTAEQVNRMRCSTIHYRPQLFNAAPTVDFAEDLADLTVTFTDLSTDADGTVVAWSWDFGDGGSSTEQNPTHTFADYGIYQVSLTVTDDGNGQSTVTVPVVVNVAPVARFDTDSDGLELRFTDTSTDANGAVVSWQWDFGDGATSTEQNPVHAYAEKGTFQVTLTITDDLGTSASVTSELEVSEGGCACRVGGRSSDLPWPAALLFGLALLAIRRRRA